MIFPPSMDVKGLGGVKWIFFPHSLCSERKVRKEDVLRCGQHFISAQGGKHRERAQGIRVTIEKLSSYPREEKEWKMFLLSLSVRPSFIIMEGYK